MMLAAPSSAIDLPLKLLVAKPPFKQIALLDTGPITNHVNFANNRNGKFAYITIGGANEVKVYRRGVKPELVATIPSLALCAAASRLRSFPVQSIELLFD